MKIIYQKRIGRLKKLLNKKNIPLGFISNPNNIYYLTGISANSESNVQSMADPEVFLVVSKQANYLFGDSRVKDNLLTFNDFEFIEIPSPGGTNSIAELLTQLNPKDTIGFEYDSLTYHDLSALLSSIKNKSEDISDLTNQLRIVKDVTEINILKKAAQITSAGYNHALKIIKTGITEKEIAHEIKKYFLEHADGISFEPIVAYGANTAIPHHQNTNTKIKTGNILLIDLGCKYQGYCGDMTRTIYIGKPSPKFIKLYHILQQIHALTISKIKIGEKAKEIDQFARQLLAKHKLDQYFTHGLGHGIGLNIHEAPSIKSKSKQIFKNGMVFSIEPGIYQPEWGGIRIEDIVYISKNKIINLTPSSKSIKSLLL